jgi:hypothetical protein
MKISARARTLIFVSAGMLIFVFLPAPAWANAGTPLMWAGLLHLVVGNWCIGLLEGWLLAWRFRVPVARSAAAMVVANYTSMGVGVWAFSALKPKLLPRLLDNAPLYSAPRVLMLLTVMAYIATVVIEWPFCYWALGNRKRRASCTLAGSFLAQTASYLLLIPFFSAASGITLYTHLRLERSPASLGPMDALIYFISPDSGSIYQIRADGTDRRKLLDADIRAQDARLFGRRSHNSRQWDLWVTGHPREGMEARLATNMPGDLPRPGFERREPNQEGTWFHFGPADILPGVRGGWDVRTGFWPVEGPHARNSATNEELDAALETPFLVWVSRSATLLPEGRVVYQLGDQIVLLDLNGRRIALITQGRGPLVVREQAR